MASQNLQAATRSVVDKIRAQGQEIESRANDIEILLSTIIEKIDSSYSDPLALVNAVDCFVRQALANLEKLKEHRDNLMNATREMEVS